MRLLACLALVCGCAPTTPPPQHAPPAQSDPQPQPIASKPDAGKAPEAHDKWKTRATDAGCTAGLTALADGKLEGFPGLGKCGRVDAEAALGSSGEGPSKFEQFGEYRVYPHGSGHVLVWFLADDIRVLQLIYPKLKKPIKSALGEPEARIKSALSADWDQWVYASKGLTAHVERATGKVSALFAYQPTTVDAFLKTDIAKVAKSEAPLEELK
jgi:hypothetical protein